MCCPERNTAAVGIALRASRTDRMSLLEPRGRIYISPKDTFFYICLVHIEENELSTRASTEKFNVDFCLAYGAINRS